MDTFAQNFTSELVSNREKKIRSKHDYKITTAYYVFVAGAARCRLSRNFVVEFTNESANAFYKLNATRT